MLQLNYFYLKRKITILLFLNKILRDMEEGLLQSGFAESCSDDSLCVEHKIYTSIEDPSHVGNNLHV